MFELNGYQMPDFPESRYPYAMISFDSSGGCAYLTFVDKVGYIKKNIIDNVWYGNAYTLGLTADMAHDESKVIYEESYVVMLDEAYKDALELLYPGINKTSWLRYTPSSKQTPSGGYYALAMNYGPQWSNFTLYDEDGNLFLSAGKKFPLQGWLNWHVIGLCSRPLPVVEKREPVAWLYNGVRLPPIPAEVMKNPYIYIFQSVEGKQYIVYGFDAKPITVSVPSFFGSAIEKLRVESGTYASANWYSTIPEDWTGIETNQNPSDAALGYVESNLSGVVWANFDVHTSDSTLYLAASDPIPVYE